jgi:hypothetical protein
VPALQDGRRVGRTCPHSALNAETEKGDVGVAKIIISSLFLVLTASVAAAAPYCAVFPWGKSCDYVTLEECLRAAGSRGGCEVNPKEDEAPSGAAPFCLVTPYSRKCIYDNASTCRMAASMERSIFVQNGEPGVCVENPNR